MELTILDRESAEKALRGPHQHTHLISCTNSDAEGPIPGFSHFEDRAVWVRADDVVRPMTVRGLWNPETQRMEKTDLHPPTKADVERVIQFGKRLPEDARILSHCEVGVSRSTSFAMVAMAAAGKDMDWIFGELLAVRRSAKPNPLVLSMADYLLGLDGQLLKIGNLITLVR